MGNIEKAKLTAAHAICEIRRIGRDMGKDISIKDAMIIRMLPDVNANYEELKMAYMLRRMFVQEIRETMAETGTKPPAELADKLAEYEADIAEEIALVEYFNDHGVRPDIRRPMKSERMSHAEAEEAVEQAATTLRETLGEGYKVEVVDCSPDALDARILAFLSRQKSKVVNPACKDMHLLVQLAKSDVGEQLGPTAYQLTGKNHRLTFSQATEEGVYAIRHSERTDG